MTTQQKTDAIKKIAANHEDNRAAVQAAALHPGFSALIVEAMNEALKADLAKVFAVKSA